MFLKREKRSQNDENQMLENPKCTTKCPTIFTTDFLEKDIYHPKYVPMIKTGKRILLLGNHDSRGAYKDLFSEVYAGPLFISDRILLSHEPVYGLPWCLNIHGHDHKNMEAYKDGCKHINLAANVCEYTPINLGEIIKKGILSDIASIHRLTIDHAVERRKEND